MGLSQPLVATPARGPKPSGTPLFELSSNDVIVTALKPSNDGKAWIVRLYGASGQERSVELKGPKSKTMRAWISDTSERQAAELRGPVSVPGWGIVTLRVDIASRS
jgi:alpha-mannosidase